MKAQSLPAALLDPLLTPAFGAVGVMKVTVLEQLRILGARSSETAWWLRMLATKAGHLSLVLAPTWRGGTEPTPMGCPLPSTQYHMLTLTS